jgi:AcrR family transcriptional regulator
MMRKTPKQSRAIATTNAVIEATEQVLERDGLAALTTNRVAERAGVSIGSLYQYFPHKESLLVAVAERCLVRDLNELQALVDSFDAGAMTLGDFFGRLAECYERRSYVRLTLAQILPTLESTPALRQLENAQIGCFRALLGKLGKDGTPAEAFALMMAVDANLRAMARREPAVRVSLTSALCQLAA